MDALPGLGPGMNAMAGVTDMVQRLAVLRAEAAGPQLDQAPSVA
jgi:hypothetical protein